MMSGGMVGTGVRTSVVRFRVVRACRLDKDYGSFYVMLGTIRLKDPGYFRGCLSQAGSWQDLP